MIVQDARLADKGPAIIIEWNCATFRFRVCSLYLRHFRILAVIESLFCDVMQMPRYSRLVSTECRGCVCAFLAFYGYRTSLALSYSFIQIPIYRTNTYQIETYEPTIRWDNIDNDFDDNNAIEYEYLVYSRIYFLNLWKQHYLNILLITKLKVFLYSRSF